MAGMRSPVAARAGHSCLSQPGDGQFIGLGAILHRFLTPRERFGNRFKRHTLLREQMELLDLCRGPGLSMSFKFFSHAPALAHSLKLRERLID